LWLAAGLFSWAQVLTISEFMAVNDTGLQDEDGECSDWIELFNGGATPVNLQGWYLTDDQRDLQKWRLAENTLAPGEYLVLFASGKDRRPASGPWHTSFRLAGEGGYLALVRPDGATVQKEYAPYPPQRGDISFGTSQTQNQTRLVPEKALTRILIPQNGDSANLWTGGNEPFDDSSWMAGTNGAGYVSLTAGFAVHSFKSNALVEDLGAAEEVIQTPSLQASVAAENVVVIDYLGTTANGHYPINRPFPGTSAGQDVDDFVILATARVTIPTAGNWTFGVMSDDGFGLELRRGNQTFAMSFPNPRSPGDSLNTFNITDPGEYDLRLVYYERGGNSGLELWAAPGAFSAWNSTHFRLVGDTTSGGLAARAALASTSPEPSLSGFIQTDLEAQMKNTHPSAYVRIPFHVPDPSQLVALFLQVRYDDGFVAYLNGAEIARRNAPINALFDSTALTNRPSAQTVEPELINISQFAAMLRPGTNILALHALNDRVDSPDFLINATLQNVTVNLDEDHYFEVSTPGRPNSSGFVAFVDDIAASVHRGFFEQPFEVALTCPTTGATIRFTVDGSPPTESTGSEYTKPVPISRTTTLRAAAFKPGCRPSRVQTHTYIFLNDVIRQNRQSAIAAGFPTTWNGTDPDYGLDTRVAGQNGTDVYGGKYARTIKDDLKATPSLSIVMNIADMFGAQGIYSNPGNRGEAWERPTSVELIFPDARESFQVDAGIRIQGGAFRSFALTKKKSFRLLFKQQYGATKLRYPLFGTNAADRFDNVILRANNNDGWQWDAAGSHPLYIRDAFALDIAHEMGMVAPHTTFVHLYINGLYWGLYSPVERPDAAFSATYFGGNKDDWDAINYDSAPDGNYDAWNRMLALARSGLADKAAYQRIQGNNPDGTRNPQYEDLLDVDSLIDYMILNLYLGNNDWPHRNYWVGRNRNNGDGFKFYPWDSEWIVGLMSDVNTDRTGVNNAVAEPYAAARANPEFRMRFADRVYRHFFHGGPLFVDPTNPAWDPAHPERNRPAARFIALADLVDRAIVPESARWGDQHAAIPYTRDEHWQPERDNLLQNYFPRRSAIVLNQLRQAGLYPQTDPPEFNQHGGQVSPGFQVVLTAPRGTILYTTDSTDPRGPVSVEELSRMTLVTSAATKRVLVPSTSNGGTLLGKRWQGGAEPFDDSSWAPGTGGVGYDRESTYQPFIQTNLRATMDNQNTSVFIRIPFNYDGSNQARLNFMVLRIRYDDGFAAFLNGTPIASANASSNLLWDSTASAQNPDSAAVIIQEFKADAQLPALRVGSNILAIQGLNISLASTDMLIDAELVVGERKITQERTSAHQYTSPLTLTDLTTIKTRALNGQEWSALNEATFVVGSPALVLTELHYHPADPTDAELAAGFDNADDFEFVELFNNGSGSYDLTGVRFTDGIEFDFTGSTVTRLTAGHYVLIVGNRAAFEHRYGTGLPVAGEYSGQLANRGERIELVNSRNETILAFTYGTQAPWPTAPDGTGPSLEVVDPNGDLNSPTNWRPGTTSGGCPGQPSPNAAFAIDRVSLESGRLRFQFKARSGVGYTVYGRDSFSVGTWRVLRRVDSVTSDGPIEVVIDLTPSSNTQFFQVSIP
jgi:hypothetical protein